jgi:hypothetical protein
VRRFGFGLGLVLATLAAAVAVAQLFSLLARGGYAPITLGTLWYNVHANSLVGFQALIEKSLSPALWPPILWLLGLPAWLLLGAIGAVLLLTARPRRRGFD